MNIKNRNKNSTKKTTTVQNVETQNNSEDFSVKKINEPRPICKLCGEQIENICEAISNSDGHYSHFDCVIKEIEEKYHVEQPDIVSYIGCGCFAICTMDAETNNYTIKERIPYESPEAFNNMKKFVEGTRQ